MLIYHDKYTDEGSYHSQYAHINKHQTTVFSIACNLRLIEYDNSIDIALRTGDTYKKLGVILK